jgi:hypothetical protein
MDSAAAVNAEFRAQCPKRHCATLAQAKQFAQALDAAQLKSPTLVPVRKKLAAAFYPGGAKAVPGLTFAQADSAATIEVATSAPGVQSDFAAFAPGSRG